jgi:small subunit ribosomal protein S8e
MIDHRYELGRQAAMTKLSSNKTVRRVRVRGGNFKFRALRLDTGNYSWGSEAVTRKARILDVVYNSSNNELVRTQTLVKNAIVQVDAAPFRQWYSQHYGLDIGKKKKVVAAKKDSEVICLPPLQFVFQSCSFLCLFYKSRLPCSLRAILLMQIVYFFGSVSQGVEVAEEEKKASKKVQKKIAKRQDGLKLDAHLEEQFASGRLLACISSRPGQCGRSDGYVKQRTCRSSERMLEQGGGF